ncbi:MAG: hypothetical protein NC080_07285 [Paraprevotella sp.]|nr:hypothetical protein [Paraprevotella sp.]
MSISQTRAKACVYGNTAFARGIRREIARVFQDVELNQLPKREGEFKRELYRICRQRLEHLDEAGLIAHFSNTRVRRMYQDSRDMKRSTQLTRETFLEWVLVCIVSSITHSALSTADVTADFGRYAQ